MTDPDRSYVQCRLCRATFTSLLEAAQHVDRVHDPFDWHRPHTPTPHEQQRSPQPPV